jgi:L-amino acid N-acyltransferase YncA
MNFPLQIEPLTSEHWPAVRLIYLEGIATGNATFQQTAPEWAEWDAAHLPLCRMVATEGEEVVGWAALAPVARRPVYAGVAEVSIYVAEAARGRGVGNHLMMRLIADSEVAGIWTLQAGIFPENAASLRLHIAAGFRVVGTRLRLGKMNGHWRDVVLLERRSCVAGCESEPKSTFS